jgi:predicted DNA-binding transcriptional regulator AlpA
LPRQEHLTQDDLRCLTVKQWATLCGFSYQTGKRLIAAGEGPTLVQLSAKRIGVRMIDVARWQESRIRT